MRKTIVALLVMVLMSQPILILGGTMAVVERAGTPALAAAEPERGCQYNGDELTNHVPIFINGTSDFVMQGWPGSGTPGSPYRIERLNITYDMDLAGIRIIETDAYFVISNCFVKQVSFVECIQLYNTSHAAIEYVTVVSPGASIVAEYVNNFRVVRSIAESGGTAATIEYGNHTVLQWNLFRSTSNLGIYALDCNDLLSQHNDYIVSGTRSIGVYLADCNRASSQYDYSYLGDNGVYVQGGENVTILGFEGEDNMWGIYTAFAARTVLSACYIANAAQDGIYLYLSPNSTIDQCVLLDCAGVSGDEALRIEGSGDTQVTNTQVLGSGGDGIYVVSSERVIIDNNEISGAESSGLYFSTCENLTVTENEITEVGLYGAYFGGCLRADVQANTVSGAGNVGFGFSMSDYVNVHDNSLSNCASGIWFEGGTESDVELNTVRHCEGGIGSTGHTNGTVEDNTIDDVYTGIYLEDVSEMDLAHNTITQCDSGISLEMATFSSIRSNAIGHFTSVGIRLASADYSSVRDNIIVGPGTNGIWVQTTLGLTFNSNEMTECGFIFPVYGAVGYFNHTFTGNLVNDLPVYYTWNESEVELSGSSWGQVILVQCENVTVTGGVFHRCTVPIQSFYSESLSLVGITSEENSYGFLLVETSNSTVSGAKTIHTGWGLAAQNCDLLTIEDSDMSRAANRGLNIIGSENVVVRNVTVEYAQYGLTASTGSYGAVMDCHFSHISASGIGLDIGASYWNVTHSVFLNATYGVQFGSAIGSTVYGYVADCEFIHCHDGVHVTDGNTDQGTVVRSEFYSNTNGLNIVSGDYWHVINCTILWSAEYGIYMSGVTGPEVYGNTIALSGTANGYSNIAQYWDDGVSRGNSWNDYVPPPPYAINVASDRYPSLFLPTEPIIDSPMDVSYPEFSTGNFIIWHPYDNYLSDWSATMDGVVWAADAWNFNSIVVNIDGLSYGSHILVLTVWDVDRNPVTDEVKVHVYDNVAPTISHLTNTEAFVGGSGQALTWDVYDRHPGTYRILRDGVEVSSGPWVNGNITTSLDSLSLGIHEYDISLYDDGGNGAHDQVIVNVLEDATWPSLDSPADIIFIVGTTENYVTWTPDDDHPKNYEVRQGKAVVDSGTWSGSRILFSLDGLSVGNYNFTLTVYDGAGHSASDSVGVKVYPYEGYLEPGAFDLMTLAIAGAAIGGVVVAVVLVYYFRKRGK